MASDPARRPRSAGRLVANLRSAGGELPTGVVALLALRWLVPARSGGVIRPRCASPWPACATSATLSWTGSAGMSSPR